MRCTNVLTGCSLAVLLLGGCTQQKQPQAKQQSGPLRVSVAPVSLRTVQRTVESVGTLFPYDETIISAEIEGKVDQINADLGDAVKQGQVLVHISDEEQRYLLAQNEAQLRMSLERLGLKDEKDRVKDVRDTPDVRRAQADLDDVEKRYRRVRDLVDQGIGSQADLDQAQSRYKAAQAGYDQSVNQIRNLIQEVDRFRAGLDLQRKKLRDATVYAPFSGRVKERQVTPGQFVRSNTPLMTVVKIDPIRLRVEIPERMAPWIKNGQVMEVTLEAFTDRKFHGKIWRISPTVDQSKRTFVIEALIDNPAGELKPGSYARAKLQTDRSEEIRLVPAKAVNYVFGANKTYVVRDGVVEAREVRLGDRFNDDVEILNGLEHGESVAVTQVQRLDTGVKVQVAAPSDQRKAD